jgi:Holliday junction resolvasome RuvABC endonuclease subunit
VILLALDPGLDATGYAVFTVPRLPPSQPGNYRNAKLAHGTIRSGLNATLAERLHQLHTGLADLIREHGPDRIVVEVPAIAGMYDRQRGKARDKGSFGAAAMTAMHHATGALLLTGQMHDIPTDTARAATVGKPAKTAWVVNIWPELDNRGSNQDERDAIYLGATNLRIYAYDARMAA